MKKSYVIKLHMVLYIFWFSMNNVISLQRLFTPKENIKHEGSHGGI